MMVVVQALSGTIFSFTFTQQLLILLTMTAVGVEDMDDDEYMESSVSSLPEPLEDMLAMFLEAADTLYYTHTAQGSAVDWPHRRKETTK